MTTMLAALLAHILSTANPGLHPLHLRDVGFEDSLSWRQDEGRVNSSATVGTEPAGIDWYALDINPLTYASFPHTYGLLNLTENHGVPGSNPGPATC